MWSGFYATIIHSVNLQLSTMSYAETTFADLGDLNPKGSCCEAMMLTATPLCHPFGRLNACPSIPSFLPAGWLVDVTGSYEATFFLSGGAMLASALTLAVIVGIRRCRRVSLAKKQRHQPLPQSCPNIQAISLP